MKKIIPLLIFILILTGCNKKEETDSIKFKKEYESLNGKTNDYKKEYSSILIDENNPIVYVTYDEIINVIKNDTAIIYFGFPECPWCRTAIPVLLDSANEMGIDKIYYFNALSIRDKKSLDKDGNIIVEEEGTEEYKEIVKLLYDFLPSYEGLNDETIKRLYFPTVVFIKNGKVVKSHIGTLDSQEDPYKKLTNEQYMELKEIYSDYINEAFEIVCDEAC